MFQIHAYKNRVIDYDVNLFEKDGTTEVTLLSDDVVRVKVGRGGGTPHLDLSSIEAESGGSSVTFSAGTNNVVVRFGTDTAAMTPGAYDVTLSVVDNSETAPANAIKHAEYGVLVLHPTMGGEVGEEESSSSSDSSSSSSSDSSSSDSSSSSSSDSSSSSSTIINQFDAHISNQIDSRITGEYTAARRNIFAAGGFNPTGSSTYNTGCWAADFDMTGISNYNNYDTRRAGTLITPRHAILAKHLGLLVGKVVTWIAQDGTAVTRQITGVADHDLSDIQVIALDSDLPGTIKWYEILPANHAAFFTAVGSPLVVFDQEEKVLVFEWKSVDDDVTHQEPATSPRSLYYEELVPGDSGHPTCLALNGELYVLACHYTSIRGPFTTYHADAINTLIATADGESPTGYTVTMADLSSIYEAIS